MSHFFVSYAHVDDIPTNLSGFEPKGWVTVLVEQLERSLKQKTGKSQMFTRWHDKEDLRGNMSVQSEIR